ncbi:DUF2079 domain-containing protein [Microcoleus sp. FACHB-831]|uniref:DUF2079 domain-containing protein n=1 Tax=Microcoleus sp. FACHB-831 TaxID=2692827 RepID=UPI001686B219|nr:DUF2079 domain-containing protein [Microcoleus sp. FACHB-831]MBD1922334.1 DUF2079 domain-containing protein [Microcoleus sp. FACHB-831]
MLLKLQKHPSLRLAIGAAIAFFFFTLIFTLHRHYTFNSSYDQGIFNQVFWNGIHGRFFQSSLSSQLSTNVVHSGEVPTVYYHRLGQHFTPALLLWLPLYALFPSPATLTVLQVTLVTAAGLVLYALARQHLEPPLAVAIAISYYCANAVLGPTMCNFHDICQIPLFTFGLLLAMEKRWWWLFWVLAVLILCVREDSGVGLFSVGFYMILSKRYPRIGLAVCTISFAYMIGLTNLIMPLFSKDISQRFMMERFGQYADGDEASTIEIIWGMVSNPWRLIVEFFTPLDRTIKYFLGQWLPLAFVPAVSPASWMVAGFPLLKLLLGKGTSVLAINIRYAMTVVPGLFYGAIIWWSTHPEVFKKAWVRRLWATCLVLSLIFTITSNPNKTFSFLIPDAVEPWVFTPLNQQWSHVPPTRSLLAEIPPDASVSTTTFLVPHLSSRREIIRLPGLQLRNDAKEVVNVDYVVADLWQQKQVSGFKHEREALEAQVTAIDQITANGEYGIVGLKDGVILLQKGAASNPEANTAWVTFRQEILSS